MTTSLCHLVSLILVVYVSVCAGHPNKKIGDSCQIYEDEWGVCKQLANCDELLSGVQFEDPVPCSATQPIVCCPVPQTHTKVTINKRIEKPKPTVQGPTEAVRRTKSYQKCLEYAESVYVWKKTSSLPNEPLVKVSQCGFEIRPLIVGGEPAKIKEFPHMVALGYGLPGDKVQYECGGFLISEYFVLTAAHCLFSRRTGTGPVTAKLGFINIQRQNEHNSLQEFDVVEMHKHPEYSVSKYNDIALLKLNRPVSFTEYVRPACLHVETDIPTVAAIATGWGLNETDATHGTDMLMKVKVPLITEENCRKTYQPTTGNRRVLKDGIMYTTQLCAGDYKKDTCQGDSGGPLQIYRSDVHCMYDIIGVTSFGIVCGDSPGVYTRVSHYIPWIEGIVWP